MRYTIYHELQTNSNRHFIATIIIWYTPEDNPTALYSVLSKNVNVGPGEIISESFKKDSDAYVYYFDVWDDINQSASYGVSASYFSGL
jgi:prephenate dehydratase